MALPSRCLKPTWYPNSSRPSTPPCLSPSRTRRLAWDAHCDGVHVDHEGRLAEGWRSLCAHRGNAVRVAGATGRVGDAGQDVEVASEVAGGRWREGKCGEGCPDTPVSLGIACVRKSVRKRFSKKVGWNSGLDHRAVIGIGSLPLQPIENGGGISLLGQQPRLRGQDLNLRPLGYEKRLS